MFPPFWPFSFRKQNQVTVVDVDECSLDPNSAEAQCPSCRVQCHQHAKCENRVGSYTCVCPACMTGDGFKQLMTTKHSKVPMGYVDGTGCVDSCAPAITLLGARVSKWHPLPEQNTKRNILCES